MQLDTLLHYRSYVLGENWILVITGIFLFIFYFNLKACIMVTVSDILSFNAQEQLSGISWQEHFTF